MKYPTGNLFYAVLAIVQTLIFNGFDRSWGMLANIYERNGFFSSYCGNITVTFINQAK